jgi:FkbM family methyltransferase
MGLLARIGDKPQYAFHPSRALRRAMHRGADSGRREKAQLPWGLPLEVYTSDSIGFSILTGGVFDPCVTETLHRLIDPGDLVVDVGANIGYLTSLAAARAGGDGLVMAFEPHPRTFELLESNAARWRGRGGVADVELHQVALSDHAGEGTLIAGPSFDEHMGMAALASDESPAKESAVTVTVARLDDALSPGDRPGALKIDVEGHEPEVLRGARRLLTDGAIRDIVFEDHDPYPSEATAIVEEAGYSLLSLDNGLFGLRLGAPEDRGQTAAWPGPSYLATRDVDRARTRLAPRGWQVKGIGPGFIRRPPARAERSQLGAR